MLNTKFWNIVRWIFFIPAAFVSLVIVYDIIEYFSSWYFSFDLNSIPIAIISSFASGMVFVIVGVKVAPPNYNKIAAFILLILIVLLDGASIYVDLLSFSVVTMVKIICSLIGSLAGYFVEITGIGKSVKV